LPTGYALFPFSMVAAPVVEAFDVANSTDELVWEIKLGGDRAHRRSLQILNHKEKIVSTSRRKSAEKACSGPRPKPSQLLEDHVVEEKV
jgi:hypothetical protein